MQESSQHSPYVLHEESQVSSASGGDVWPPLSQASHRSLDELRPKLSQSTPRKSPERPVPSGASGATWSSHWSCRSDGSRRSGRTVLSAVARDVLDPTQHPRACCLLCCRHGAKRLAKRLSSAWQERRVLRSSSWRTAVATAELERKVSKVLHPHQRSGVRWLFKAHFRGGGILGDEPGLGKTLQAVALVDALVSAKLVSRVLLVVTAEMVLTWASEFRRFLPDRALELVAIQRELPSLHATDLLRRLVSIDSPDHCIVLISYEGLHAHGHVLHGSRGVDLLVADEAHRLRNLGSMATSFLRVPLRGARQAELVASRLLLTGTPLPNNVMEFVHLMDIAVPGILGPNPRDEVAKRIVAGTMPGSSQVEQDEAALMSEYLADVTQQVMLRRTNAELERGLPEKYNFLLMVRPTQVQRDIHASLLDPSVGKPLMRLNMVRNNLIHPELLLTTSAGVSVVKNQVQKFPERPWNRLSCSGKLQAVGHILNYVLENTKDKVVVVSSSLQALGLIGEYVREKMGVDSTFALIGHSNKRAREKYKRLFNSSSHTDLRVLLLIDKLAEGQTLTGANHLLLVDPTWNPALDLQSLGRIRRPGQTKPCWLYRLLATGSVDETIIERQAGKVELLHMLSSKQLPGRHLDDHHLVFTLDGVETSSRLRNHLEELPDLCYSSASWGKIDLNARQDALAALQAFPPVLHLAQQVLLQPDVGAERLSWVAPTGASCVTTHPSSAISNEEAPDFIPQRVLSYVFHSTSASEMLASCEHD